MSTCPWLINTLRALLILLFGCLLAIQVAVIPAQFRWQAQASPEHAHWQVSATAITIFWIACLQAVIACTWGLLNLVSRDRIFSDAAAPWVNAILVTIGMVWVSLVVVIIMLAADIGNTIYHAMMGLALILVTAVGLLMTVMRALLRQATTLRTEMDQVV
ncbi:DUF2975 domain-containing protein [Nesterenkonia muleiensis]|uniref:DUF2975 domain-containing protein n=1 Tax=Nesterenkonia muleiensis TaxID=2282648 RepID=UPI000E70B97A|nr:DUF2975 domain-containing protein [Nesterenkonia muleiensis]